MNLLRLGAAIHKELLEIARDTVTVWVCLLLPLIMLFLFGYAISLDVKDVRLGVWDRDNSGSSRQLTDSFVQSGYFRLSRILHSGDDVDRALQTGDLKIVLVIPEQFEADLIRATRPSVQILVDGTFSNIAQVISNYADAIVHRFRGGPTELVRTEVRVWYNPEMRSVNYVIPGLFGVILMAVPPLLTALAVVREKESGSIQQIFASPLTRAEFIVGKLIPYAGIAFAQILMVIVVGLWWFDVPFRGSISFLISSGLIYVLCTVGIGLLVSTVTRSQVVAMLLVLIIALMPSFLFSGFLFPIFTMPYVLQLYTAVLPGRYFIEVARGIAMKGSGPMDLWPVILLLLAYTLAIFALATWRFRKKVR